jgi:hypothetical protein
MFKSNSRVDTCLIVIEKKERVDSNTVLAFELLDMTLEKMTAENLCIIFTKTNANEDDFDSAIEFYEEAWNQAKCMNLPPAKNLNENCVILLER